MKVIFAMQTIPVTRNFRMWMIKYLCVALFFATGCVHSPKTPVLIKRQNVFDTVEKVRELQPDVASKEIGLWRTHCKKGRARYCYRIARLFQLGIHLKEDRSEALLLFQRGCQNKHKMSCLMAGKLSLDSSRTFYSPLAAISSFAQGCQLKEARACYEAGSFWLLGDGVKENFNKAATYFGLSCRGEFGPACTHLGVMAQYGIGISLSQRNALLLFEKGCSYLDPAACFLAARILQHQPATSSKVKAVEMSELSCLGSDARGCVLGGDLARKEKAKTVALEFYERACGMNNGMGCYRAGLLSNKPGEYFSKACVRNVSEGCIAQGLYEMEKPKGSLSTAALLFENACVQKQPLGCFQLSRLYRKNPELIPGPQALKKAQHQACRGGIRQACEDGIR
jgi:uncharacterized protein